MPKSTTEARYDVAEDLPEAIPAELFAHVTAVLVVHDGAAWLDECLDGLTAQTFAPQRVIAVDTGSEDGSLDILRERLGSESIVSLPRETSFGAAVAAGVAAGRPVSSSGDGAAPEWLWLLHDDCAPEPDALAALLAHADASPSTWAVAPKTRDWSGARIGEFGATIDRTGHRETWFDGHDLDQGQADGRSEALAASTAGMLLRRSAWDAVGGIGELGWPTADDLDLGWRIHAAGGRVTLTSAAVVRHAAAMTRGRRRPDGVAHLGALRRQAGMRVVLANSPRSAAPLLWLRLVLGAALRATGLLLLLRRPALSRDELVAATGLVRSRRLIGPARGDRRSRQIVGHRDLRRMLAGVGDRWRHLLEAVRTSLPSADPASSTRSETGPVDESAESLDRDDAAALRRFLTRPSVALFVVASGLTLIAERHLLGGGLAGGRLLPAPAGASDLWRAYLTGFHPNGMGSFAVAPPGLAVLALLSSILLGHADLAVNLLVLGAVPLAALSAWHASRALTQATPLRLWAAAGWATLPVVTGSVGGGRLDGCVTAILLPLLARAMVGALQGVIGGNRGGWGRVAGTALLLAVISAFAPLVWAMALIAGLITLPFIPTQRLRALAGVAGIAGGAFVACEPWSFRLLLHPINAVAGFGLPEPARSAPLSAPWLLLLHAGAAGEPARWVGAAMLLVAVAALARNNRATRIGWVVLVTGYAGALVASRVHGVAAGSPTSRGWAGIALMVAGLGAVIAVVAAAERLLPALERRGFGLVQPAAAVLAALSIVAVGWSGVTFLIRGAGPPLRDDAQPVAPVYVGDALTAANLPRALVVNGGKALSVAMVRRVWGADLTDAVTTAAQPPAATVTVADAALRRAVGDLVAGRPAAVRELAALDISYLVAPTHQSARRIRGGAAAVGATVTPATGVTVYHLPGRPGELTVQPVSGGAAKALAATGPGTARTDLAAAATPRRLLLAEPANGHWTATLAGRQLTSQTVSGWEQAFQVPAGLGGRLQVGWSQPLRTLLLALQLAVVVAMVLLALPLWRLSDGDEDG